MNDQYRRDQVRQQYNNGYYDTKLQEGLEYQDYVTSVLYQRGFVIVTYSSKKWQHTKGENMLGAEIKRDGNFRRTGNLYIEIAEKTHPDNANYVDSGIMRNDNSWLYIIGDEMTIYVFPVKYLVYLFEKNRYKIVDTPTSRGMLMPLAEADRYCIKRIDIVAP